MSTKNFKLDIVFFAEGLPFNGNTLKERSLGGSETQNILLARELAARGHNVTVFSNCEKQEKIDGVRYTPIGEQGINYYNYMTSATVDVCVVQRQGHPFSFQMNSKLNVLWIHDLACKRQASNVFSGLWNVDSIFGLSDFHINQWNSVYGIPKELFFKTRNGIDLQSIKLTPTLTREKKRIFNSGRPERGFELICDILPMLWKADPDIEFYYATYSYPGAPKFYNINGKPANDLEFIQTIVQNLGPKALTNFKFLGSLTKKQLYEEMQKATLYVYPTDFEDTSHITTMECMANGLPLLGTNRSAVKETLASGAGLLLGTGKDGECFTPEFKLNFADNVLRLLYSPNELDEMRKIGIDYANKNLGVDKLAEEWEQQFYKMFKERNNNPSRLAKYFYDRNDLVALSKVENTQWDLPKKTFDADFSKLLLELQEKRKTEKCSIIIPTIRQEVKKQLEVFFKKSSVDHEYIVIYNGVKAEDLSDLHYPVKVIENDVNVGFTKALNQGIKEATTDYFVLVNDDCFPTIDWDYNLLKLMKEHDVKWISPNYANLLSEDILIPRLAASFFILPRKAYNEIGEFDERFFLVYSDDDYKLRMEEKGYTCYVARDVKAFHQEERSRKEFDMNFMIDLEQKDQKAFLEKYKENEVVVGRHKIESKEDILAFKTRNYLQKGFNEYIDTEYISKQTYQTSRACELYNIKDIRNIIIKGKSSNAAVLFLNKIPNLEKLTCVSDSGSLEVIKNDIKQLTLQKGKEIKYITLEEFDTVQLFEDVTAFYCEELDEEGSPTEFVDKVEAKLNEGTLLSFSTLTGEWDLTKKQPKGQVHNFEKRDLLDLFEDKQYVLVELIRETLHPKGRGTLGHYFTSYVKNSTKKTGTIDFERKLTIQVPRETLSVCMITENSEDMISRCLKSIKDIADEIIICDSGSTDRTLEICKQFTDKIYKINSPRKTGFDVARNNSISKACGDWILWIDSDEEFLTPHNLVKYLRNNFYKGYAVKQHHFSAQPPNAFPPDIPCRVFRNNMGIAFYGKIHEHPEKVMNESVGATQLLLDVDIAHDGYLTEEGRRKKFVRNFPLLQWDRQVNPNRTLGKFLFIRDLIHASRYALDKTKGVVTQDIINYCELAIKMFKEDFLTNTLLLRHDGLAYYSEALTILRRGIDIEFSFDTPGVSVNNMGSEKEVPRVQRYRFESAEDFLKFYTSYVKTKTEVFNSKYI